MLLVFSTLPGWEHADLHLTMRWGKCVLLFYCLGNQTERKAQRSHFSENLWRFPYIGKGKKFGLGTGEARWSLVGKWGERGYHFCFQHLLSLLSSWVLPQPRACYLGKTQKEQGDVQGSGQGPANRKRKALGLKYLVVAKLVMSKQECCHILLPVGFNSMKCSVWMHQILLFISFLTLTSNCTAVCPLQVLGHLLALSTLTWDLHPYPCSCAQESHICSTWSLQSWVILWELLIPHPSHCHVCACLWTLQVQAQKTRSSEKMGFSFQMNGNKSKDSKTCSASVLVLN